MTTAGVDYDQLVVGGTADFGDTLALNVIGTYSVANNDTLDPIAYGTYGGNPFATIIAIGGEVVTPDYTAPDLTLTLNLEVDRIRVGAGGDNFWNNPANWDLAAVPSIINDVLIDDPTFFSIVQVAANADANTIDLAAGMTLSLTGGTLTIANDSTFDGDFDVSGGTLDLNGSDLTLNGGMDWSNSATLGNGKLILPPGRLLTISGGITNILDDIVVDAFGDTIYSAGNLLLQNNTDFNNFGSFDFAADVGIAGSASSFDNRDGGQLVKSAGAATSAIAATITTTSTGSIAIASGTLDLGAATTVQLDDAADRLVGGNNATLVANVNNTAGIVRPGGNNGIGVLTITGNYNQTGGRLEIEVQSGGNTAGTDFDQLAISGNGSWSAGSAPLEIDYINAYVPSVGDSNSPRQGRRFFREFAGNVQ